MDHVFHVDLNSPYVNEKTKFHAVSPKEVKTEILPQLFFSVSRACRTNCKPALVFRVRLLFRTKRKLFW